MRYSLPGDVTGQRLVLTEVYGIRRLDGTSGSRNAEHCIAVRARPTTRAHLHMPGSPDYSTGWPSTSRSDLGFAT